jgi:glutamate dehydrogenase
VAGHPLRREIVGTIITNDVINSMGITFVARMATEIGATPDEISRAFLIAREVSQARSHWDHVERLGSAVPVPVQAELMGGVDSMVEEFARWYLRYVPELDLASVVARDQPGFAELLDHLQDAATSSWRLEFDERLARYHENDVPEQPARFGAAVPDLVYAPDIIAVARETGRSIAEVAHAFFVVGERLYLNVVEQRVAHFPAESRWQRLAWRSQLDDLRLLRRQIVERVIAESRNGSIDDAVESYLRARSDPYDRLSRMMENVTSAPPDDSSMVMVAVHQIRQVAA